MAEGGFYRAAADVRNDVTGAEMLLGWRILSS